MFHHCHPTTHLLVALTQSIKSSLDSLCSGPSRYLVAFSRLTRLVMLDGGGPGYTMLYPSWRSQKWVPQNNIPIVVTFQREPFFISMIVGGRVYLVKFGLDWNRFDTQKDLDFFFSKQPSKTPLPGTRLRSTTPQTDLHCSMPHGLNDASAERYHWLVHLPDRIE